MVHTDLSFDEVKEKLSQLRKLEDALQQGLKDISKTGMRRISTKTLKTSLLNTMLM